MQFLAVACGWVSESCGDWSLVMQVTRLKAPNSVFAQVQRLVARSLSIFQLAGLLLIISIATNNEHLMRE